MGTLSRYTANDLDFLMDAIEKTSIGLGPTLKRWMSQTDLTDPIHHITSSKTQKKTGRLRWHLQDGIKMT